MGGRDTLRGRFASGLGASTQALATLGSLARFTVSPRKPRADHHSFEQTELAVRATAVQQCCVAYFRGVTAGQARLASPACAARTRVGSACAGERSARLAAEVWCGLGEKAQLPPPSAPGSPPAHGRERRRGWFRMSAEVTSPGPASHGPSASEKDRQEVHSAMRGDQEPSAGSAEGVQTRGRKRLLERSAESEQDRSAKRAVRPAPLGLLAVLAAALSAGYLTPRKGVQAKQV
jgi:hypothetical protein